VTRLTGSVVWRHGLPGAVGTGLIAAGALGIGWTPPTSAFLSNGLIDAMRTTLVGSLMSRSLVIVGLAVLLQAWLILGSELLDLARINRPTPRDLYAILAVWTVPLVLSPPLFSRDVFSYYVQGRVYGAGFDPTVTGVSVIPGWMDDGADPMWVESPTPYGPLFLIVERTVASIAHPNGYLAAVLFRLVAVVGVALIAVGVTSLARRHGIDPDRALWLGVLNPVIVMHFISGAHNDALMVGLVVAGMALAASQRCAWGIVAIALAMTIKPIAIVALPFAGLLWAGIGSPWSRRIRAWLLSLLVAACTVACVFLVADAGRGLVAASLSTPAGVQTWLSPTTALGKLVGFGTTSLGLTPDITPVLAVARLLGLLAAVVIIAVLVLRPAGRSSVRAAGLALLVIVVLGPVVQPWYLLWSLPLLAAAGLGLRSVRAAVILTAFFTVHAMIESSTNADNVSNLMDVVTLVLAVAVVAIVVLASSRERALVLGDPEHEPLIPFAPDQIERGRSMVWPSMAGSSRE
jgi:hypothetical protein